MSLLPVPGVLASAAGELVRVPWPVTTLVVLGMAVVAFRLLLEYHHLPEWGP